MNIKKYSTVFMLIFLHTVFMQGSGDNENSPLLPMGEKPTTIYTQNTDLESYIKIEKEKLRAEHIEKERQRIEDIENAKKKNRIKASLKATLIADSDPILWNCHRLLSTIATNKDENIATLKSVITQLESIKTQASYRGEKMILHESIYKINCSEYYNDGFYRYFGELTHPEKYCYFYPSHPKDETVKNAMVILKDRITRHLSDRLS